MNIVAFGDGIFCSADLPYLGSSGMRALGMSVAVESNKNYKISSLKELSSSSVNWRKYQKTTFLKKLTNLNDYDDDGENVKPKSSVIKDAEIFLEYMPISFYLPWAEYYYGSGVSLYWDIKNGTSSFSLYGDGTVDCFLKIAGKTIISKTVSLSDRLLLSNIFERISCANEN